jgi:hypothetical protein
VKRAPQRLNEESKIMLKNVITFTAVLMAVSAIGFLFFPSNMLAVVGIVSNEEMDFLLRTAGVGVISLMPGVWALRTFTTSPLSRAVLTGLLGYLFLSSLVDLYAYIHLIVNAASLPSIAFRILLGSIILWLVRKETTER